MPSLPKVAVVYLSFHCEPYLPDLLPALKKVTYPKDRWALIVVDNPHPVHGHSTDVLLRDVQSQSETTLPRVILLSQETNTGFSGGNNAGIRFASENGYDYVYLLNNDALPEAGFLEPLVDACEKNANIGCAQSLITLYPQTDLLNTSGNALHYLGYGYSNEYKSPTASVKDAIFPIGYASGAGILLRTPLLQKYGLWDEDFWMYHEDTEYSLRLFMLGYDIVTVRDSVIGHKYEFTRSISKFHFMERNRYAILFMFYKVPTLLLLVPIALASELGMLFFAWRGGWLKEKLTAYRAWLSPAFISLWLKKRKNIQKTRVITDRVLLKHTTGKILFQESSTSTPVITYIANPIFSAYRQLLLLIVRW